MAKYIQEFTTEAAYNTARTNNYIEPWVSLTDSTGDLNYNKSEYEKLLSTPLTFKIQSAGDIKWEASSPKYTVTLEYKLNDGKWTEITSIAAGASISVVNGDTVQFRAPEGEIYNAMSSNSSRFNWFRSTAQFSIKGNIMSLLDGANFSTMNTLSSGYTFYELFYNCTSLTDTSKLLLPAITLTNNCYDGMFDGCTSITTAPELPATTLAIMCYFKMFNNCINLNYIKCLATDISASYCTTNWVYGVASTGTFIGNPNSSWSLGNSGIPTNWNTNVENIILT